MIADHADVDLAKVLGLMHPPQGCFRENDVYEIPSRLDTT
jgi:hypothetical protein